MKAWLKGGLIGILISFVLVAIAIIFNATFLQNFLAKVSFWFSVPFVYISQLLGLAGNEENLGLAVLFIFLGFVLEAFIVGAIIGLIIGKIKEKKK